MGHLLIQREPRVGQCNRCSLVRGIPDCTRYLSVCHSNESIRPMTTDLPSTLTEWRAYCTFPLLAV